MINRSVKKELLELLSAFPAVAILGPRQVGKTTLAKDIAKDLGDNAIYLDLESNSSRAKLFDPESYFQLHVGKLIILDEIHRMPQIFSALRGIIDERRAQGNRYGQFLILGSASLDLIRQSSETLAGRIAYKQLSGLLLSELDNPHTELNQLWLRGGFPDSFTSKTDASSFIWRQQFIGTYLERDVPQFGPRIPATLLNRLWTMLAHNQGGMLNTTTISSGLGVSNPTARKYIDLLEDLLLLRTVMPWSGNVGKRLVKTPRVYIRDSGLTHALLDIVTMEDLLGHPVVSASWEGFVLENIIASLPMNAKPYFYRTAAGAEIDLVIEKGSQRMAIEIKRSMSPVISKGFHIGCQDLNATQHFVVYPGEEIFPLGAGIEAIPIYDIIQKIHQH